MKGTLSTPPPPQKKKCNELFSKADGFSAFIFMKVKVTPLSNEFLLDVIQTFQGYQFRLYRKKFHQSDNSYPWEVEGQKVKEAEDRMR